MVYVRKGRGGERAVETGSIMRPERASKVERSEGPRGDAAEAFWKRDYRSRQMGVAWV